MMIFQYILFNFSAFLTAGLDDIRYPLPKNIATLVKFDAFKHLDTTLTKSNYRQRMHTLLYIEEYQRRANLQEYEHFFFSKSYLRKALSAWLACCMQLLENFQNLYKDFKQDCDFRKKGNVFSALGNFSLIIYLCDINFFLSTQNY